MHDGFLTIAEIIERHETLFQDGFNEAVAKRENVNTASYDLHLGQDVYLSGDDYPRQLTQGQPLILIPRGQFALLMTDEYITMPKDYFGLISIKFSIKVRGLINVSGFHIDPGFSGRITFSVFNAGPVDVMLEYGKPTFMIFFYKLHCEAGPYKGDKGDKKHLPTEFVTSAKGVSASLADVDKRVRSLETSSRIWWALLLTVIAGLTALLISTFNR
ncbi:MAG: hypothetical protein HY665_01470 [Chloroflexi bacterium]|nr:hypothetical protein [Chloroflexota bacterium]